MRLLLPVFLGVLIALGQKTFALFRRDTSDADIFVNNLHSTDIDSSSNEEPGLLNLSSGSDFTPASPDDSDPLSPEFVAVRFFGPCHLGSDQPNSKVRTRQSEVCSEDQIKKAPAETTPTTPEIPNVLDGAEKAPLEFSLPEMDLTFNRPTCTNKKFVTHVCCDGPPGEWRLEGYFASIEHCWPCT